MEEDPGNAWPGCPSSQLATFCERAVDEPGGVLRRPLTMSDQEVAAALAATLICTAISAADLQAAAEQGYD